MEWDVPMLFSWAWMFLENLRPSSKAAALARTEAMQRAATRGIVTDEDELVPEAAWP